MQNEKPGFNEQNIPTRALMEPQLGIIWPNKHALFHPLVVHNLFDVAVQSDLDCICISLGFR